MRSGGHPGGCSPPRGGWRPLRVPHGLEMVWRGRLPAASVLAVLRFLDFPPYPGWLFSLPCLEPGLRRLECLAPARLLSPRGLSKWLAPPSSQRGVPAAGLLTHRLAFSRVCLPGGEVWRMPVSQGLGLKTEAGTLLP